MESGLDDRLAPLIGKVVTLHVPLMGGPPRPLPALEITQFRGIYGVLTPVDGEKVELRPGVPGVVRVKPGDPVDRLECVVAEQPSDSIDLVLRFPKLPERRTQSRYYENFEVTVQLVDETFAREIPGMAVDVSAGGLRMRCDEQLSAGDRVFLSIGIPGDLPALAIAEVVADARDVGNGGWEVRVRFCTMADDEKGRLIRHVTGGIIPVPIG
ncbi:MAG: PilZ domain-containing protein [Actinomycetota bacterium]